MLFKSYCMCLYDAALWSKFNAGTMEKLRPRSNLCIKIFVGQPRLHSVTAMLSDLGLPTLSSLPVTCQLSFRKQEQSSATTAVRYFVNVFGHLSLYDGVCVCVCICMCGFRHCTLSTLSIHFCISIL